MTTDEMIAMLQQLYEACETERIALGDGEGGSLYYDMEAAVKELCRRRQAEMRVVFQDVEERTVRFGNENCGGVIVYRPYWKPPSIGIGAWMDGVGTEWSMPLSEFAAAFDYESLREITKAFLAEIKRKGRGE